MPQGPADVLAWLSVAAFLAALLADRHDRRLGRYAAVGAWASFAVFWFALVPHFAFVKHSIIEGVLSAAAVPASLYVGYLLWRGRDSLFVLTRAIAVMGAIYLPFTTVPWLYEPLVEFTVMQVNWGIELLGYDPPIVENEAGIRNTFVFHTAGHIYRSQVLLACTGLGSMTIFVGLAAAVRAPLSRKLRAVAVSVPIIWTLNIARNVFIAVAQGKQWFADVYPSVVLTMFGASDPHIVSFLVADRIISQSLSVVALLGILYLVVRELPEVAVVVEDLLFMLTGTEYDLRDSGPGGGSGGASASGPARADGGSPRSEE
ncbi:MAG: archaeosortase A [Haloarculaceae archaeon]